MANKCESLFAIIVALMLVLIILHQTGTIKTGFTNPTKMRQHQEFDLSS